MALVYFDPSALVKLCVPETGSGLARRLWDRADVVVTSRLTDTELRAALAAGLRAGIIGPSEHDGALGAWAALWPAMHLVEVTGDVAVRAARLVGGAGSLRAGDAVHVASALTVAHDDTLVAAWDPSVAGAARAQGLRVLP